MLAAEKHKGTFIAPVGIGLSLFIAELSGKAYKITIAMPSLIESGVFYTGGSLNPARSLGPCVILHSFEHYHWIYWVGPIFGALLASGLYRFMKLLEYETANPGQDFDEHERAQFDPEKHTSRPPPVVEVRSITSDLSNEKVEVLDTAPGARIGHSKYATTG